MSDNNYLKFFIEEEVYVLPGDTISESTTTVEKFFKPPKIAITFIVHKF